MKKRLSKLLEKYAKTQREIDILSEETSAILATSGVGQAPPVFHRKVDQMLVIKEKKQAPLWDELRTIIIPNSRFNTFWQEIRWTFGTLPPDYREVAKAYLKYNPETVRVEKEK